MAVEGNEIQHHQPCGQPALASAFGRLEHLEPSRMYALSVRHCHFLPAEVQCGVDLNLGLNLQQPSIALSLDGQ